jgi:hypothetical protein
MPFIEAPTTFYLGRKYDPEQRQLVDEVVYYDSRDLTTHAVVVGMTGSGKTGMCISMLEEAVLDNIPALIIDPKGDITNMLLAFPQMRPEDFAPWVNPEDAARAGLDLEEYAQDVAQQWRDGLTSWSIVPQRVQAYKNAARFSIYTPGSDAGLPVSILDSFQAPPEGWAGNEEGHRERISGTVTALLALIGRNVEPVRDREHVLISNLIEYAWRQGQSLTVEDIIVQVQKPPFARLGVFDVDTFFPEKERFKLAMELNNIIAAPSFQTWITGESLDVRRLLYTPEGRPRVSIFYIAHLTDAERTFIITLLLENLLSWMRTLSGTSSLRAVVYFDEVFGHFPPAPRNPPTKEPILRLLKQARAFGIGMILATQNPGDLDYKGLANAGTWIIGKLQTDNDKAKILGGLQSASTAQNTIDLKTVDRLLSNLAPRVFLMNNIHDEGGPTLVHSRWSMSFLRGPITRQQVRTLMEQQRQGIPAYTPAPSLGGFAAGYNAGISQGYTPPPQPSAAPLETSQPMQPSQPMNTPPPPPSSLPESQPMRTSTMPPPPPSSLPEVPRTAAPSNLPEGFSSPMPSSPGVSQPVQPIDPYAAAASNLPAPIQFDAPPSGALPPVPAATSVTSATRMGAALPDGFADTPPPLPSSVAQFFLPTVVTVQQAIRHWEQTFRYTATGFGGAQLLYRPVLLAQTTVRYLDRKSGVEAEQQYAFHVPNVDRAGFVRWAEHRATYISPAQLADEPFGQAFYGVLSAGLTDSKRMNALRTEVVDYLYRSATLSILHNPTLGLYSQAGESQRDFAVRAQQKAREARDAEIDAITAKYDDQLQKLDAKLQRELRQSTSDKQVLDELKREDLYTTGEAVLSLMRGRTTYTLSRMSRARRYKKQAQEKALAGEHEIMAIEDEIEAKQQEYQNVLQGVNDKWAKIAQTFEEVKISPYKKDIALETFGIGWIPVWYVTLNNQPMMLPAFSLE